MKKKIFNIFILPIIFCFSYIHAQDQFSAQNVIDQTQLNAPTSVHSADLDNDGDMDVLSASSNDDKIVWYENDGTGSFSTQQVITTSADGAQSVYTADLDNDGDIDVLSASDQDDKIAWYENDGTCSFGAQQVITTSADGAQSVYTADLDNDGDMDVLSASDKDDKIAWYENDGTGGFSSQQIITTSANMSVSVYAADFDNDGDLDVPAASWQDNQMIVWYENDGTGNFGAQHPISTQGLYDVLLTAADLDCDGDQDIISASDLFKVISWFENDGTGSFGARQYITKAALKVQSVNTADLDNDGDLDLLSASLDRKIAWYENDGTGGFGTQQVITRSVDMAESVYAADLDNDGDLDVLSASNGDNKIAWYENLNDNSGVVAQIRLFLEGPYQNGSMSSWLSTEGHIPLQSPYIDQRQVSVIPANVTDWVFVQLRELVDGPVVSQKSFFLRNDGWIVNVDGITTALQFPDVTEGNYFIVVKHRNHLTVMSATAHPLTK